MPLFEWNSRFLLGVPEADRHHKYLVWLFNKVYDEYMNGASPANLGLVIKELVEYAAYHFETEERSMKNNAYPKFAEHKAEHVSFTDKVYSLQQNYSSGNVVLITELFSFLEGWVNHHILGTDGDYGQWLRSESENF